MFQLKILYRKYLNNVFDLEMPSEIPDNRNIKIVLIIL